jgi:hypothetical protein
MGGQVIRFVAQTRDFIGARFQIVPLYVIAFYRYRSTHNPKVVGSNSAPATNQINDFRESTKSNRLLPIRKIAVQALAFIGLSTISTTFPFASRFDDDIACR